MSQSKEEMLELLIRHGVNAESHDIEGDYNRTIEFTALGLEYKIVWFVNISRLYIGHVQVMFNSIDIGGTWPNSFKSNINFRDNKGTVCVLPIEEY